MNLQQKGQDVHGGHIAAMPQPKSRSTKGRRTRRTANSPTFSRNAQIIPDGSTENTSQPCRNQKADPRRARRTRRTANSPTFSRNAQIILDGSTEATAENLRELCVLRGLNVVFAVDSEYQQRFIDSIPTNKSVNPIHLVQINRNEETNATNRPIHARLHSYVRHSRGSISPNPTWHALHYLCLPQR